MTGNKNRDLRARNLELFRRGVPDIYARLEEAGQAVDEDLGAPPAERTYSARFTVKAPSREDLDAHTYRFLQGVLGRATAAGIAFFAEPRSPETYFLVVVGAGHGGRLLALLERVRPLCVVVVEPDAGALRRSFDSVDWTAVFRAVRARKGELHFLLEDDADRVS
ncbi:MAG: hypothetical protein HYZ04_03065, partial [Rhodospirillales bacterium]|nr:hypothetical protein [Rhodospirillales bacterium]